jgi:hypothetical protein
MVMGNKRIFLELWQQTKVVPKENYMQQRLIG